MTTTARIIDVEYTLITWKVTQEGSFVFQRETTQGFLTHDTLTLESEESLVVDITADLDVIVGKKKPIAVVHFDTRGEILWDRDSITHGDQINPIYSDTEYLLFSTGAEESEACEQICSAATIPKIGIRFYHRWDGSKWSCYST